MPHFRWPIHLEATWKQTLSFADNWSFCFVRLFTGWLMYGYGCEVCCCCKNNYFSLLQVLMVAKRKIKAGDEVSDNYGIHFLSLTVEERQEALLKGFAFCCWCEACQKDYPRLKSLRTQLPEDIEDRFDKMRDDIKEMFRRGNHEKCLNISKDMIKLLESGKVAGPHRNYELAALSLISCLWKVYGNKA